MKLLLPLNAGLDLHYAHHVVLANTREISHNLILKYFECVRSFLYTTATNNTKLIFSQKSINWLQI